MDREILKLTNDLKKIPCKAKVRKFNKKLSYLQQHVQALYIPYIDTIILPRKGKYSELEYLYIYLHETVHSTAHHTRIGNRFLTWRINPKRSTKFPLDNFLQKVGTSAVTHNLDHYEICEELVADLVTSRILHKYGLPTDLPQESIKVNKNRLKTFKKYEKYWKEVLKWSNEVSKQMFKIIQE